MKEELFNKITKELRCPVCQNQSLAESDAALSMKIKSEIRRQILQGEGEQEIIASIIREHGDYVRYMPPFSMNTIALWIMPFLLIILSVLTLKRMMK